MLELVLTAAMSNECAAQPTVVPPTETTITPSANAIPPTPQANLELGFFCDLNPADPFNLQGTGLNSKRDSGEPNLPGFAITHEGQNYTTDENGIVRLTLPSTTVTTTIVIPNTNKTIGQKDMAALGIQFSITMYEPDRVNYGPRFFVGFCDDNCQRSGGWIICEIGVADGYITSPYKGENYLYASPWTFDSGLNYERDFANALTNGSVPSPAGGMYQVGGLGKFIASYANANNRGAPYGYPYLLKDPALGIIAHMLMDVRNDLGVPIYALIGGTICKSNSSGYIICAIDATIDINDIRAVPNWQYGLPVTRGQLIGWADPVQNIIGEKKPFPLIHMGISKHRDRAMTLARFPYLTAEKILMGAKPDQIGQLLVAPREQVVSDCNFEVHLPHAPVYTEK